MKRIEFHSHTSLSGDGSWAPLEMIKVAREMGQHTITLTDHVGMSNIEYVIESLLAEREAARAWSDFHVLVGCEITHVPAKHIPEAVRRARAAGAEIVLVHGETLSEPVEPGTNLAAVGCSELDVLAHPGLITLEEAQIAAKHDIYLEISSRRGHSLTNGHVALMAREAKCNMLVNTDAHQPSDLISFDQARRVALGAGLNSDEAERAIDLNAKNLFAKALNPR